MIDRIDVNIDGGLDIPLPRMAPVRQIFDDTRIEDIPAAVAEQFKRPEIAQKIKPGAKIAVGAGSRGVANIRVVVTAVVSQIKELGGEPFVFPAMGSHGAATAEGQKQVLEGYGITEESVGCPVRATMETKELGQMNGDPVYADAYAAEADGIVLINRIKPHTNFRAEIESGVVKMMCIGMGKIRGATTLHTHGMDKFDKLLPATAEFIMSKLPFLFGVGLVENAHDETMMVEAMPAEKLFEREKELQAISKTTIAKLFFDSFDVLIIDEIGKDISGAGADPNVIGGSRGTPGFELPTIRNTVMLDLTDVTHGNATGMAAAQVITMKMFKKIDFGATYANIITSSYLEGGATPMIMNTPKEAVAVAIKSVPGVKPLDCRVVWIRNTLELTHIAISEAMLEGARADKRIEVLAEPESLRFDGDGELLPLAGAPARVSHAAS